MSSSINAGWRSPRRHVMSGHVTCLLLCAIGWTWADTTTPSSSTDDVLENSNIPVALITLAVLAVCIIIGVIIAKAVDHCYDRRAIRDDVSDISEFTKELLKAQFLYAFNKKLIGKVKSNETVKQRARRLGRIWVAKARRNLRERKTDSETLEQGERPDAPREGATLVSVKVVDGAATNQKRAPEASEQASNKNNNHGVGATTARPKDEEEGQRSVDVSAEDPGTSATDEKGRSGPSPGKKGSKSPPGKRKNARASPTRGKTDANKTTGSPKRRKQVGKGKRKKGKKQKAKKSQVGNLKGDGDVRRDGGDVSGSETDSDDESGSESDTADDDAGARTDVDGTSPGRGVTSEAARRAHVTSAPCRQKHRVPATVTVEREATGSECSSRDDYEFLANSARRNRKRKTAEEAWATSGASSPGRRHNSGTLSKLSMSVDSSLL